MDSRDIRLWDGVVRTCHWLLVTAFVANYFVVEPGDLLHEIAGYGAAAIVLVRIGWGLRRTGYASFATIDVSVPALQHHLTQLKLRRVPADHGHNPFGWLMIVAVIVLFLALAITGFMMQEIDALWGNQTLEWVHAILADILYVAVLIHIAAVVLTQWWGRVSLIRPMITGRRPR